MTMQAIVIDASMAAAWTLEDEKSERGDEILREIKNYSRLTLPLFWYEYGNILISNQNRGRVAKEKIPLLLRDIRSLELQEYRPDADAQVFYLHSSMRFHFTMQLTSHWLCKKMPSLQPTTKN